MIETLDTLGAKLTALGASVHERFVRVDEQFAQVDERFAQVDERFAQVDARFAQVDERFDRLEKRVEDGSRAVDEHFIEQRAYIEFGLERLEKTIDGRLANVVDGMNTRFDRLERKLDQALDIRSNPRRPKRT
jgi:DNA anti-recombination protein RmuC